MKPLRLGLLVVAVLPVCAAVAQTKSTPSGKTATTANAAGFEALVKKADAAREADQSDEATRLYKQLVRMNPEYVEGWWYLGILNYEADQSAEHRAAFRHVTCLDPQMP